MAVEVPRQQSKRREKGWQRGSGVETVTRSDEVPMCVDSCVKCMCVVLVGEEERSTQRKRRVPGVCLCGM